RAPSRSRRPAHESCACRPIQLRREPCAHPHRARSRPTPSPPMRAAPPPHPRQSYWRRFPEEFLWATLVSAQDHETTDQQGCKRRRVKKGIPRGISPRRLIAGSNLARNNLADEISRNKPHTERLQGSQPRQKPVSSGGGQSCFPRGPDGNAELIELRRVDR